MMNKLLNNISMYALLIILATPCLFASGVSGKSLRAGATTTDDTKSLSKKEDETSPSHEQQNQKDRIEGMLEELLNQNRDLMEQNKELMERNTELTDKTRHLQSQATGEIFARRVFATSVLYHTTDFGGLSGADKLCQTHANTANLGGIYKAWLSDSTGASPATRFYQAPGPYVLVDGTVIAKDWADLTDGSISAPIHVDENGNDATFPFDIWTATKPDGTLADSRYTCSDWTSMTRGSGSSIVGSFADSDHRWTNDSRSTCDANLRLYCFEQYPTA